MLTSLLLGAALAAPGAPVPASADPAPSGPAPWVLYLKADESGRAQVMIYKTQKITQSRAVNETVDGKVVTKVIQEQVERMMPSYMLFDTMNPALSTVGGAKVTMDSLMKRAKTGVSILVSADGKPISKSWLRTADPEAVIAVSDSLVSEIAPRSMYAGPTQPPRLALLATDMKGKVQVAYNPNATNNNNVYYGRGRVMMANGQQMFMDESYYGGGPTTLNTEAPVKALEEVSFEAYDLKGKGMSKEEALKRLAAGGYVLIAGDNRLPDESFLKHFRGDLVVLVSQDLVNVPSGTKKGSTAVDAAPAPVAFPAVRGVVRPAVIQALPLKVAPAPAPAPAQKEEAPKAAPAPAQKEAVPPPPAVIRRVAPAIKVAPALPAPVEKEAPLPK